MDRATVCGTVGRRFEPSRARQMTLPTHFLAGLIIGKITGDFPTAISGSLIIDLDHLISYWRHGILFNPNKLLKATLTESDPWGDQRNLLHSLFSFIAVSTTFLIINLKFGFVFSIAYFFHLVLDGLDGAAFYPFFPLKSFLIKGFIHYYSKQELIFALCLVLILLGLWII